MKADFVNMKPVEWRADAPYDALPLLPPAIDQIESRAVLKACINARAALGELRQAGELIPNQSMLISLLPILEARASSEIENIVTTTDKLFQHAYQPEANADPATKEALRYSRALFHGYEDLQYLPLTTRTLENLCSIIKGVDMSIRRTPGTALVNDQTGRIVYTPPEGEERLRGLLANWETFINTPNDLDPVVRMAVAHYQLEAIHPFSDGNGRTGRIVNSLILIQDGLLTLPILYLSRYIIRNKSEYYRLLQAVTAEGAWEEWVLYIVRGIEDTALWTTAKISAMRQLMEQTAEHVRTLLPKIYRHELISLIFERPYCRIADLIERGLAKRQTASIYLKSLVGIGVLEEVSVGKEKLFLNARLMSLLQYETHDFPPFEGREKDESLSEGRA